MIRLSIIIPTRNRADLLEKTLISITNQNLPQIYFEVIVIDNGSTDSTKVICDIFSEKFKNFTYKYAPQPGLHIGRNLGLQIAKAEILVYADDDIEAFPDWLEGIWESFQKDEKIGLVGGKNLPKWEINPPDWILEMWNEPKLEGNSIDYFSILNLGDKDKYISPLLIWGCNFSIRKSILLETEGFHPDGMPNNLLQYRGDGETYVSNFIARSHYKAFYSAKASIYHFVPASRMTEEYLCFWTYRMAIGQSFQDIREGKTNTIAQKRNRFLVRLKNISFVGKVLDMLKPKQKTSSLIKKLNSSFTKGYNFHQSEIMKNPKLLDWIKKENFLNINNLPYYDEDNS